MTVEAFGTLLGAIFIYLVTVLVGIGVYKYTGSTWLGISASCFTYVVMPYRSRE